MDMLEFGISIQGNYCKKINVVVENEKLKKILNCIFLWDNDYIFVGYDGAYIILVDIKNGNLIKKLKDNDNAPLLSIEKISTDSYGECLVTQGFNRNEIKLWVI